MADETPSNDSKTNDDKAPRVVIETSMGDILVELAPDKCPKTVANFLAYVDKKHYDGTIFHRVIPGFMIQGGGMLPDMSEKPTDEPVENEAAEGLSNTRGTIAMARTMAPHSATNQFFINVSDNGPRGLDHTGKTMQGWGYCAFGTVVDGMDVADKIVAVKTGSKPPHDDVPIDPVMIKTIRRAD